MWYFVWYFRFKNHILSAWHTMLYNRNVVNVVFFLENFSYAYTRGKVFKYFYHICIIKCWYYDNYKCGNEFILPHKIPHFSPTKSWICSYRM